jgi:hypothetical protein
MALWLIQPLTEMSTRNLPGGKERPAPKADNLTAICEPIISKNVRAWTFQNPMGLHGLLTGIALTFLLNFFSVLQVYRKLKTFFLLNEALITETMHHNCHEHIW